MNARFDVCKELGLLLTRMKRVPGVRPDVWQDKWSVRIIPPSSIPYGSINYESCDFHSHTQWSVSSCPEYFTAVRILMDVYEWQK